MPEKQPESTKMTTTALQEGSARSSRRIPAEQPDYAYQLAQTLREASEGDEKAGLRAWLSLLDATIATIETTAWEARALADEAVQTWKALAEGWGAFSKQVSDLSEEAGRWPGRISRLASTGWMLTKVASSYRFFRTKAAFLPRRRVADAFEELHARNARRFFETSIKQGGAFLKVGQMLSARPDLLPESWVSELSALQDDVPPEPFEFVRAQIEAELGRPMDELFAEFDEEPIAAASIGQVHRAVTLDGVTVAVKVQRPQIAELIELDMSLLEIFLESMSGMLPPTDMETIVEEVKSMVRAEVAYRDEANAMEAIANLFAGAEGVIVPHPVPQLSADRVMTSTFVKGEKITTVLDRLAGESLEDGEDGERARHRLSHILGSLLESYLKQVLEAGLFQADPHPGNFLVTENDEVVLLDFGCTKALPETYRKGYMKLMQSILTQDRETTDRLLTELGFRTQSGSTETLHAFIEVFLSIIRDAASHGTDFAWPTKEELFGQIADVLEAATRDPVIKIPAEFVMLARVFGTLGGMFQHYQPSIDYGRTVLPYLAKAM